MRVQCLRWDQAVADTTNDVFEILMRGIAATDQHHLALMEFRVLEGDGVLDHAYKNVAAAVRDILEPFFDGLGIAGRFKDAVETLTVRLLGYPRLDVFVCQRNRIEAQFAPREIKALVAYIDHADRGARQARKKRGG